MTRLSVALLRLPVLAVLAACGAEHDYIVTNVPPVDYGSAEATIAAPSIQITVDASYHRNSWGTAVDTCDVTIAFSLDQHDADAQVGTAGDVIEMADESGECVLSVFEPGEPPEAMEWDPPAYVDVGDQLLLEDEFGSLTLAKEESADGTEQRYRLDACGLDNFPFGRSLDIVLPEGVGAIPPTTVSDALVVPGAVTVTSPAAEDLDQEMLPIAPTDTLVIAWSEADTLYGEDAEYDTVRSVTLRNQDSELDNQIVEAVNCLPEAEDFRVQLSPDVLGGLTPNGEDDPDRFQLSGQIDIMTQGRNLSLPWGEEARMHSAVQVSGMIELIEAAGE